MTCKLSNKCPCMTVQIYIPLNSKHLIHRQQTALHLWIITLSQLYSHHCVTNTIIKGHVSCRCQSTANVLQVIHIRSSSKMSNTSLAIKSQIFAFNKILSSDQLRAASLIGRNAVTWLWALSNVRRSSDTL